MSFYYCYIYIFWIFCQTLNRECNRFFIFVPKAENSWEFFSVFCFVMPENCMQCSLQFNVAWENNQDDGCEWRFLGWNFGLWNVVEGLIKRLMPEWVFGGIRKQKSDKSIQKIIFWINFKYIRINQSYMNSCMDLILLFSIVGHYPRFFL